MRPRLLLGLALCLAVHDADGRVGTIGVCDLEPLGPAHGPGAWVEDARGIVVARFGTPAEAVAWVNDVCAGDF